MEIEMIKKRKIDHIGLATTDVESCSAWYQDVMGFSVIGKFVAPDKNSNVYFLTNGDMVYEIYQDVQLKTAAIGKIDHVAFFSEDIESDYEYCVERGYQICTDGIEGIPHFWEHGIRYFKIMSATGEMIEFCQKV